MNVEELRNYCLAKSCVTEEFPFDETTLVFKVCNKMFLVISLDNPTLIRLKCEPTYAIELRERYAGINAAFHFNKMHWNQVSIMGDITDKLLCSLIDHSYAQVVAKLPKSQRRDLHH
ncbi:MAG: MmcQ/YjbR family DNA-binding protein [Cellulosilyticaceae bacterium]